jgi:ABC-type amino acid transport substrate-binding protein
MCKTNNEVQPVFTYDISGSEAWAPYYMQTKDGREYGILPELMSLLFKQANLRAKSVNYPPKRTNIYIKEGILDMDLVNPVWISDLKVRNAYVYSEGLFEVKEYYMSKSSFDPNGYFTNTLKPKVGMVRGYYYHNQDKYTRLDFPSEKTLIEALERSRIAVIISGDLPALYWAKKLGTEPKFIKLHSEGQIKIRMRKELAYLLPQLNQAIIQLKQQGVIEQLMKKYQ